jgi:CheY-like chemotaxis protein
MKKIDTNIQLIGVCLAALYAVSFLIILGFIQIPEYKTKMSIYVILFGSLFLASLAIVFAKEWGRKLLVLLNGFMVLALVVKYIPQIDLIPGVYFALSFIVFVYFSQDKVVFQFLSAHRGTWKSVLVVDDDPILLKMVRPILMNNGYSVLTALSGEEGLTIAKSQQPDLIILDVILPGIKGREVCKRLKADSETHAIPVIFLTSKDSPDDVKAELDAGALRHLTKPVNSKLLIQTVKEILA